MPPNQKSIFVRYTYRYITLDPSELGAYFIYWQIRRSWWLSMERPLLCYLIQGGKKMQKASLSQLLCKAFRPSQRIWSMSTVTINN